MTSSPSKSILALDWGESRVGVAVSPDCEHAFPREHISFSSEQELLTEIEKIIQEDSITLIILGLPQNLQGVDTKTTEKVRTFGKTLSNKFSIEVLYEDERLTSQFAEQKRVVAMQKGTDSLAALAILENYLAKR